MCEHQAVLPTGLSESKSASVSAWVTYQAGGIVRKYVSFKECNLVFVLFY